MVHTITREIQCFEYDLVLVEYVDEQRFVLTSYKNGEKYAVYETDSYEDCLQNAYSNYGADKDLWKYGSIDDSDPDFVPLGRRRYTTVKEPNYIYSWFSPKVKIAFYVLVVIMVVLWCLVLGVGYYQDFIAD